MTSPADDCLGGAARDAHFAMDSVLPLLGVEEADRFAADLTALAERPEFLLSLLSLGRALARGHEALPVLTLVGGGHGVLIEQQEGLRRLDAITVRTPPETWAESKLATPSKVIEHLGISRSTLHNWRRDGLVIALRRGRRNHVYPLRQFSGAAPLPGIAATLAAMSGPEEAWEWLVTPNVFTGAEPPLALLERGDVDDVVRAASSALDFT